MNVKIGFFSNNNTLDLRREKIASTKSLLFMIQVSKWSKWSFYGHILRYIHYTGPLGGLSQHQSHLSLQHFTKVLDDPDRNNICDHL